MPIKRLTPDRHLQLIERILCHIIRIQLIHFPNNDIHIWLMWFSEQQEFCTREGLEAREAEVGRFEDFNACSLVGRYAKGGGRERFGDCMDTEGG